MSNAYRLRGTTLGERLGACLDKGILLAVAAATHVYHNVRKLAFDSPSSLIRALNDSIGSFSILSKTRVVSFYSSVKTWERHDFSEDFAMHWPISEPLGGSLVHHIGVMSLAHRLACLLGTPRAIGILDTLNIMALPLVLGLLKFRQLASSDALTLLK